MNGNYSIIHHLVLSPLLVKRYLAIGLKFVFERNRRLKCCGGGGFLIQCEFKNKTLGVTAFIKEKNQCKVIRLFLQLS